MMTTCWRRWKNVAMLGVLALAIGCMTVGLLTKREAVAIIDHAMTQSGCKRSNEGIDSTFSISVDRFKYHADIYEVTVETTHEQGRVARTYQRGRKKSDRDIDIPWSAVTRVLVKSNPVAFSDAYTQSVEFYFMRRGTTTEFVEDSFEITNLRSNPKYERDAVSELALAIKVLAGMEPAARDDYHYRRSYDYDQNPAWRSDFPENAQTTGTPAVAPTPAPVTPAPATTVTTTPSAAPAAQTDVEKELARLKDLYERGLITAEAYKERQLQVLSTKP